MYFLKRSLSFTRFRVVGKFSFSQEKYQEILDKNVFRDFSELEEADESMGWVSPDNYLQGPKIDSMMIEPYLQLVMRVDRRRVPAALFMAHLSIEEKAALASTGKKRLSLNEKRELRRSVRKFLLAKTSPSNAFYKALWNFKTSTCYLFSTSKGVQNRFAKLFSDSFTPLVLEALTPWMMAIEWAQNNNSKGVLNSLDPASFLAASKKEAELAKKEGESA